MNKIFLMFTILLTSISALAKDTEFTIMHGPGGVSDIVSRFVASEMAGNYLPVNRPGGGGLPAISHMVREDTMMIATMVQVFVTNPINHKTLNYSPNDDIAVLATIGIMPSALVCNIKTGFKSYADFQNSKKKVSLGFGGYGSSEHIATEVLLLKNKNIQGVLIPYATGGSKSVADLLGGHIDCIFANFPTIKPHLANENLIALLTSHNLGLKISSWEDVYKSNFPFQSYLSVIVSKRMDERKREAIRNDLIKSFSNPNYKNKLMDLGMFPVPSTAKKDIVRSLEEMEFIRKFLSTNNVSTSEK